MGESPTSAHTSPLSPAEALKAENEALKKQLQQAESEKKRLESSHSCYFSFGEEWSTRDPVHGAIGIPVILKKIIDTKIFQRLRRIKQTSMCEFLYDGATHTRFEHSIGVCYLAFTKMEMIRKKYPGKATRKDVLCVCIAGLCHDLGHPLFSHTFEEFMHHQPNGDPKWSHEDASLLLLDVLFKELRMETWGTELAENWEKKISNSDADSGANSGAKSVSGTGLSATASSSSISDAERNYPSIYREFDLDEEDMKFIKKMVDPPKKEMLNALKEGNLTKKWSEFDMGRGIDGLWMFQIVSDWINGLDVDRIDYFARDSFHLFGEKTSDYSRYFQNLRLECVPPDRVCRSDVESESQNATQTAYWLLTFPPKDVENTREIFYERRKKLHQKAYQHKLVKKTEQHILQLLTAMNDCGGIKLRKAKECDWEDDVIGLGGGKENDSGDEEEQVKEYSLIEAANLETFQPELFIQLTDDLIWRALEHPSSRAMQIINATYRCNVIERNMMREIRSFPIRFGMEKKKEHANLFKCISEYVRQEDVANAPLLQLPRREGEDGVEDAPITVTEGDVGPDRLRFVEAEIHQGAKGNDPLGNAYGLNRGDSLLAHLDADESLRSLTGYSEEILEKTAKSVQKHQHLQQIGYVLWNVPLVADRERMNKLKNMENMHITKKMEHSKDKKLTIIGRSDQLILKPKFTKEEQRLILIRMGKAFDDYLDYQEKKVKSPRKTGSGSESASATASSTGTTGTSRTRSKGLGAHASETPTPGEFAELDARPAKSASKS